MNRKVLLLAPSRGLGGGIERYAAAIEASLHTSEIPCGRIDLRAPGRPGGLRGKIRFIGEVGRAVRSSGAPTRLIVAHRNLLPAVYAAARQRHYSGTTVILHGHETWSAQRRRASRIMRREDVRIVAGSSFTAGAVAPVCRAGVLHPGIAADWYRTLVDASRPRRGSADRFELITAFRLPDWKTKGLPTVIEAVELLGEPRIRLTVCGTGRAPSELREAIDRRPWATLAPNLTDGELAERLGRADLFVLATRTRAGARASGEGFGLAMLEAQLAGTPVIAPAYGGGHDAFQHGLTGLSPVDETPQALSSSLAAMLGDDRLRERMARAAADWSRHRFDPAHYTEHLVRALLGDHVGDFGGIR
ncbi:glycosyltransferase family 4 protein [Glycomyces sp. L485]|uniref:glycosyltransferase family 4 protein n=1 Tax=Glycomyces sp. L485 TaxID=2909235 RepID=UPI001F4A41E6|nr:glycosyltransferase family 4 protein [Glycomyces sp. L485]MCH7230596.1 glycosyltransferase family 4 protein [Glycomyces sp. L485]